MTRLLPDRRFFSASIMLSTLLLSIRSYSSSALQQKKIAIVGGGASGIFAAISAASSAPKNAVVHVLEATSSTLKKVSISGGGRCNVLHDTSKPTAEILAGYPRGFRELNGLYEKHFTPQDAKEWFTSRGVVLKTESDGRMFPTTDKSQTIIDTLLNEAHNVGVQILPKVKVVGIFKDRDKFRVQTGDESVLDYDAVILATGSAPIGYKLAQDLGHTIVPPVPSLFTLNCKHQINEGGLLHGLSGVSVPTATVSLAVQQQGKKKPKELRQQGPLLITHHGISGPATLRLSAFGAREFHEMNYRGDVRVHWAPALGTCEEITAKLWQLTTLTPKKNIETVCPLFVQGVSAIPKRLWASMVEKCELTGTKWCEAPKKKIQALASMVGDCVLDVTGKGVFKEEFVTAGGVILNELDMKMMQSKKVEGLFLCGEVLNVDGVTGGFNFMNCWSTGYIAGKGAAGYCSDNSLS
jgi:predicted Rossmann fold flavoprotein